jgi:Flp pilus assembly protein TadD
VTRGWLALAAAALGLAALLALALVAMRMPALAAWTGDARAAFGTALALHVNLATYVWVFGCAAALWAHAGRVHYAALGVSTLGLLLVALSPLFGGGQPVLSNYVPVLDQPLFLAGLIAFWAGIALSAATALWRPAGGDAVWPRAAPAVLLAAIAVFFAALAAMPQGARPGRYELVFWGFGHVVQIALVLLLVRAWRALAERAGMPLPRLRGAPEALTCLALVPVAWIVWSFAPASSEYRNGFTQVMSWASWPGAAVLALVALTRVRVVASDRLAARALFLSAVLFCAGLAIGAGIQSGTTLVPAHYHGTVGALTLAFLVLGARATGVAGARALPAAVYAYASGTVLLIASLAWMGAAGVPRKTPGMPSAEAAGAAFFAGLGGLLAVAGALVCAAILLRALWERPPVAAVQAPAAPARRRRDVRPAAIAATLVCVLAGGALLAFDDQLGWPASNARGTLQAALDPAAHAAQRRDAEFDQRFAQAVVMLHARQYEHAVTALHRLLELRPDVPEVHVNMGYALLGMDQPGAARDFFEGATALRSNQVNAYYGLAVALERLGDMEGALGAMRTFVHLTPPDDPYIAKARSAIAEWESRRRR